jgi:hypothetical protein
VKKLLACLACFGVVIALTASAGCGGGDTAKKVEKKTEEKTETKTTK